MNTIELAKQCGIKIERAYNSEDPLYRVNEFIKESSLESFHAACVKEAMQWGLDKEKAAIEAMSKLSLNGVQLNEHGALALCHAFLLAADPEVKCAE